MVLLAVTADTWIVTGLGFGIVLLLLCCLVYILQLFGWTMQKATAPKAQQAPKEEKKVEAPKEEKKPVSKDDADLAAAAYALYLAQNKKHDIPTAMISLHKHSTAWNEKSIGLNNVGF